MTTYPQLDAGRAAAGEATKRLHQSMAASAELKEARENLIYWQTQARLRSDPKAITEARALASAWQTTVDAKQELLQSLTN
jgi:hypothetical protein